MSEKNYCLVLSGGGAKGVYHIGVWRALQEIGIPIDAFIGNSIGAIIAGFLTQGEAKKMEEIGSEIGIHFILNIPDEFIKDGEVKITTHKFSDFKKFYQNIIGKKGLDTFPLRKLLKKNLNEKIIREKGNDLGIVTYSISDMKPLKVFIEDMEEGELINYLLASSALPGFEQPEIGGKKYIDGGVYDNIPYSMAKQRGYKNIIVSDISGLGVRRKMDITGTQTVYIKNSINMGGVLDFDKQFLKDYTYLGYLDTLKTFGRLVGYYYFFVRNEKLEAEFRNELLKDSKLFFKYLKGMNIKTPPSLTKSLKDIFPEYSMYNVNWLSVFIDCAAKILSVDRLKKWTYDEMFEEIKLQMNRVEEMLTNLQKGKLFNIEGLLKNLKEEKELVESPYYYLLLIDNYLKGSAQKLARRTLFRIFPELPAGVFYLKHFILQKSGE